MNNTAKKTPIIIGVIIVAIAIAIAIIITIITVDWASYRYDSVSILSTNTGSRSKKNIVHNEYL